jgi:hypothetical protein
MKKKTWKFWLKKYNESVYEKSEQKSKKQQARKNNENELKEFNKFGYANVVSEDIKTPNIIVAER